MTYYRAAGKNIYFQYPISELEPFAIQGCVPWESSLFVPNYLLKDEWQSSVFLIARVVGWVGGANRQVETWSAPPGTLLRVDGGSDFYLPPGGQTILSANIVQDNEGYKGGNMPPSSLSALDREILLGPALVLTLAMRGTWSLHASAAMFQNTTIAFLGESGQGKSTLAAYLSSTEHLDWRLVADDILPVTAGSTGIDASPHFPQLKLPMEAQPGVSLPEQIPLNAVCVLASASQDEIPELRLLSPNMAVRELISHTAGTRLFTPELLMKHLAFCTQVAGQVPVYELTYPHRRDTLPAVKKLLENIS